MKEYSVWIDEAEKIASFHEVDNSELKPKTIAFYESMTKLLLPCFSGSTLR